MPARRATTPFAVTRSDAELERAPSVRVGERAVAADRLGGVGVGAHEHVAADAVGGDDPAEQDALAVSHAHPPGSRPAALRRRLGAGCFSGLRRGFGCRRFALEALLAGLRLLRVVARLALQEAGLVEEAGDAVGRLRADGQPMLGAVEVELHAVGVVLRQHRIVRADLLDVAAVARGGRFGNDDVIVGRFLAPPRDRRIFTAMTSLLV